MSETKEIKNRFLVGYADGREVEHEAGAAEVGAAGELILQRVFWSGWERAARTVMVIAPGLWTGYRLEEDEK